MSPKPIRLVVADDHPVVRAGLLAMLGADRSLVVVGAAADGVEALELIERERPDVALLDLRMPKLDGVGTIRALAERGIATRVLVVTTFDRDADLLAALDAGVSGYLLKDAAPEELLSAIRAVAEGRQVLASRIAARVAVRRERPSESLSAREVQILGLIARGLSNKLVGVELRISEATVKTHVLNVFAKLGVDDRTAAVTEAIRRGVLGVDG